MAVIDGVGEAGETDEPEKGCEGHVPAAERHRAVLRRADGCDAQSVPLRIAVVADQDRRGQHQRRVVWGRGLIRPRGRRIVSPGDVEGNRGRGRHHAVAGVHGEDIVGHLAASQGVGGGQGVVECVGQATVDRVHHGRAIGPGLAEKAAAQGGPTCRQVVRLSEAPAQRQTHRRGRDPGNARRCLNQRRARCRGRQSHRSAHRLQGGGFELVHARAERIAQPGGQ